MSVGPAMPTSDRATVLFSGNHLIWLGEPLALNEMGLMAMGASLQLLVGSAWGKHQISQGLRARRCRRAAGAIGDPVDLSRRRGARPGSRAAGRGRMADLAGQLQAEGERRVRATHRRRSYNTP